MAVAEGNFGRNILPDDPSSLAEVLEKCAQNRLQLDSFSENGHRYVARFDHANVLADFERTLLRSRS